METIGWILLGIIAFIVWSKWEEKKEREEEKERKERKDWEDREIFRCKHGIPGAKRDRQRCPHCIREYEAQQVEIKRKKLEEKFRKEQEEERLKSDLDQVKTNAYFLRNMEPIEFEKLVLRLYEVHGFSVQHTPASGDNGIDGFIKRDNLLFLLQCKRFSSENNVGRPAIQMLYGNVCDYQNKYPNVEVKGLLVTTSSITNEADQWVKDKPIEILTINELIDFVNRSIKLDPILLETFLLHNPNPNVFYQPVDVDYEKTKNLYLACKKCGGFMEIKEGKYGLYFGCSNYPRCRYTQSFSNNKKKYRRR